MALGVMNTPSGLSASSAMLAWLVRSAYGLRVQSQVTGGPDWAKTEPYDIQAKMSGADIAAMSTLAPADQKTRRQLMLQALLHSETRQVPVFDLVTTKNISKLKDAATDPNSRMDKDGKPSTGSIRFMKDSANVMGESMSSFAGFLSGPMSGVNRPVVDKTGLTSAYDFTLSWSFSSARASSTPDSQEDDTASIFGALKEVGLKLQPSTGPIEIIVIDHAERPTAD
jgi:bla regulator protein blaR1